MIIADWVFDTDEKIATALIKATLRNKIYQNYAIAIWSSDDTPFSSWLRRVSFFRRCKVNIMIHRDSKLLLGSLQCRKWQKTFTCGSSDNI